MSGRGARAIPADGLATWRRNTGAAEAVFGKLSFDGGAYVPDVSGQNVVIACVGPLTPIDDSAKAKYPVLRTYPLIEPAPSKTTANGAQEATLYTIAPGYYGFGAARVPATLEWIDLRVISGSSDVPALLLRCLPRPRPLRPPLRPKLLRNRHQMAAEDSPPLHHKIESMETSTKAVILYTRLEIRGILARPDSLAIMRKAIDGHPIEITTERDYINLYHIFLRMRSANSDLTGLKLVRRQFGISRWRLMAHIDQLEPMNAHAYSKPRIPR